LGQVDAETYRRAVDLEGVRGERLPTGRSLTPGEIAAMFGACNQDATPAGVRDAAVLALLRLGLRRQEVAGLHMGDLDEQGEAVKVRGKGDKERLVPLAGGAADAIADWLTIRGDEPGPLLWRVNKGGRVIRRGLSPQAVYNVLRKRAAEANVKNLTPHDWRRTFAGISWMLGPTW
jgi:site-specific recombinase XerD